MGKRSQISAKKRVFSSLLTRILTRNAASTALESTVIAANPFCASDSSGNNFCSIFINGHDGMSTGLITFALYVPQINNEPYPLVRCEQVGLRLTNRQIIFNISKYINTVTSECNLITSSSSRAQIDCMAEDCTRRVLHTSIYKHLRIQWKIPLRNRLPPSNKLINRYWNSKNENATHFSSTMPTAYDYVDYKNRFGRSYHILFK